MTPDLARLAYLAKDVGKVALEHAAVDPADVLDGAPTSASTALTSDDGVEIGLWEITPGTVTDTEVEEVFVVLSGRGRVDFEDGTGIDLAPGTAVHLTAGQRTTWTIHETLRKVYVMLPEPFDGATW
jgi:uncharacterized cupin superfamily protein